MTGVVDNLNTWSQAWAGLAWAVVWQSTLIAAAVALLAFLLRRASPALRYWLWQLVAIKLLVMPFWVVAVPMPWSLGESSSDAAADVALSDKAGPGPGEMMLELPLESAGGEGGTSRTGPRPPWWQRLATLSGIDGLTWQAWLFVGWLVVLVWLVVCVIFQRVRLGRLLRRATPIEDAELVKLRDEIADQLKLVCRPPILAAAFDGSPFVCGVRRPVLVLPRGVADELDADQLRQVLAHELAHVRRRDLVWGWITELARTVYFFHPIAHWVSYRVRLERELACDQIAMQLAGITPARYAETLVQIASRASEPSLFKAAANTSAGLNGTGNAIRETHQPRKERTQ